MELTKDNYFSPEANAAYMSASQYKAFCRCEAAALAESAASTSRPRLRRSLSADMLTPTLPENMAYMPRSIPKCSSGTGT